MTATAGILLVAVLVLGAPTSFVDAQTPQEMEASLLRQLEDVQRQIAETKEELSKTQGESKTLAQQVRVFDSQIKKITLQLRETDLLLSESQIAIDHIDGELAMIDGSIKKQKIYLMSSIRALNEYGGTFFDIFLSSGKFSDFFGAVNDLEAVNQRINASLQEIKASKGEYQKIQEDLEGQKEEQLLLRSAQEYQRIAVNEKKDQKETLLKETKGKETLFKKRIDEKQKTVAQISNQLFVLQNTGGSLRFEEAVKLARYAGGVTGVRPAFLLAILSKESNIGKNVGTGTWKKDMYDCYVSLGKRDFAETQKKALFSITEKLGLDPNNMPFSREPSYGCGGAMGAAQFLPTTWLNYEDQIASYSGHNPPNPWNLTDAFIAASLLLRDLGASEKTATAEWTAAMKYLAGSNWRKPSLAFYGDHVMDIADKIQEDISIIEKG